MSEFATIVHRGITLRVNPVALTAQVRVHFNGRPDEPVDVAR
jgi:hypothetical protein